MFESMIGMTNETDSVAAILTRAFDSASTMPAGAAELILRAQLPETDVKRVEELLEEKRRRGLTSEQEALLSDYLQVDSLLTILKSKARAALSVQVTK
jgi:hypothetical protein